MEERTRMMAHTARERLRQLEQSVERGASELIIALQRKIYLLDITLRAASAMELPPPTEALNVEWLKCATKAFSVLNNYVFGHREVAADVGEIVFKKCKEMV